jgi:hypothetical protein
MRDIETSGIEIASLIRQMMEKLKAKTQTNFSQFILFSATDN